MTDRPDIPPTEGAPTWPHIATEHLIRQSREAAERFDNGAPTFTGDTIRALCDRLAASLPRDEAPVGGGWPDVDTLAQIIRRVDGSNSLGAGALAEAIIAALPALSRDGDTAREAQAGEGGAHG